MIAAGGDTYSYDANGNMTSGGGRTLVWDGEDRPIEIDGVTFRYGPDGARWKKVDTTTGTVTLTLGEIEIQNAGTAGEAMVKYLPGSARRSGTETLWHHKDHLNSIQAVTDATGAIALRRIHAPYGKRIHDTGASFVEAKDYIGERLDEETGLLYLNARYYDPMLGVFISGDPTNPLKDGVGINRYAYAGNNPVFYSDPYGLHYGVDIDANGQPTNRGRPDLGDHPVRETYGMRSGRQYGKVHVTEHNVGLGRAHLALEHTPRPTVDNPYPETKTLSAGPTSLIGGNLKSDVNRPTDAPDKNKTTGVIEPPEGVTDDEYWGKLEEADERYCDCLGYSALAGERPVPMGEDPEAAFAADHDRFNSNGYVAGIVGATGGKPNFNIDGYAGSGKPVPGEYFGY